MRAAVLDTGPIVGLLHAGDVHHDAAVAARTRSVGQGRALATTWEVVGEAYTLIRTRIAGRRQATPALTVLQWAEDSGVVIHQSIFEDQHRAMQILRSHRDLPLSYVDALVLAICERLGVEELLTVDSHLAAVRLEHMLLVTTA